MAPIRWPVASSTIRKWWVRSTGTLTDDSIRAWSQLAATVPADVKFKDGTMKHLLKTAMRPVLPESIAARTDKMGFPVPLVEWFRGPIRDFVGDILLSDRARQRGLYQMDGVEKLMAGEQNSAAGSPGCGCDGRMPTDSLRLRRGRRFQVKRPAGPNASGSMPTVDSHPLAESNHQLIDLVV